MAAAPPSELRPDASPSRRLEFETLISNTSTGLMSVFASEVKAAIEAAVSQVRTFFAADRCALLTVCADRPVVNVFAVSGQRIG